MDCIVHGIAKSWTRLSDFHFQRPLSIPKIAKELEKKVNYNRWEKMREISGGKDPGVRRRGGEKICQRTVEEKVQGMCFWEETRRVATWGYWLKSWNIKGKKTLKRGSEEVLLNPVWQNTCGCVSHSVMSDSLHGLWAHEAPLSTDSPGKNTGVSCHFLLQGIFLTQGSNLGLLHWRQILYHLSYREIPTEHMGSKMPLV